jgi:hypothetical protein
MRLAALERHLLPSNPFRQKPFWSESKNNEKSDADKNFATGSKLDRISGRQERKNEPARFEQGDQDHRSEDSAKVVAGAADR